MMQLKSPQSLRPLFEVRVNTSALAINNHGQLLCCERGHPICKVTLYDAPSQRIVWEHPTQFALACALAEDGTAYVGEQRGEAKERSMLLTIKPDGKPGRKRKLPVGDIRAFALASDRRRLGIASAFTRVHPWVLDAQDAKRPPLECARGHYAAGRLTKALAWTSDGTWLVGMAEMSHGSYSVAAIRPGEQGAEWRVKANAAAVRGEQIVTWQQRGTGGLLQVWQPGVKKPLRSTTFPMGLGLDYIVAFNEGDHLVASEHSDLYIFDSASGDIIDGYAARELGIGTHELFASPDGRYVVVHSPLQREGGPCIRVFEAETLLRNARRTSVPVANVPAPTVMVDQEECELGWYMRSDESGNITRTLFDGVEIKPETWFIAPTSPATSAGEELARSPAKPATGWSYERDADGRIRRARYLFEGRTDADHAYDDEFYAPDKAPGDSFPTLAAQARNLSAGDGSRATFLAICRLVEQLAVLDSKRLVQDVVPELREALGSWPSRDRMAPWLWINRLVTGALPVEVLHLVTALSLTAAMTDYYQSSRHYPLLRVWLETYPVDGPAPDAISISMRRAITTQIERAADAEPNTRYRPTSIADDPLIGTRHMDVSDYPLLFRSPLLRNVRIFDASWDATRADFSYDYGGILEGRGLVLGKVAEHLRSERLEVLNLAGQCDSPRYQLMSLPQERDETSVVAIKKRVARLHTLDLGAGHPLGDASVMRLVELCPQLRALSLWPGPAASVLDGYDFAISDEDDIYGLISRNWSINDNDDIDNMRITSKGWKALATLPLERVALSPRASGHLFGPTVEILTSEYGYEDEPQIAAWETYFAIDETSAAPGTVPSRKPRKKPKR